MKIVVFLICFTFAFAILPRVCTPAETALGANGCIGYGSDSVSVPVVIPGTTNVTSFNLVTNMFGSATNPNGVYTNWWALLTAGGVAALGALISIVFPNPYTLFLGICTALLVSLLAIPWSIVGYSASIALPQPFGNLVATLLFGLIILAVFSFYRGGGDF